MSPVAPGHDASGDRRSGATVITAPSGCASRHDAARRASAALRPLRGGPATSTCSPSGTWRRAGSSVSKSMPTTRSSSPSAVTRPAGSSRAPTSRGNTPMPVGPRSAGPVVTGSTTASWASRRVEATMTRPAIAAGRSAGATPHAVASDGSSRWNSQRSAHAARIEEGSAPGRSDVITQAIPLAAPSATMRRRASCSAASAGVSSAAAQGGHAVDGDDHVRGAPLHRPPPVELAGEAAQQSCQALALVRPDHAGAVREIGQRVEPLVTRCVDHVDVHV